MRILASPAFINKKVNPYNALLYQEVNNISPVVEEYSHLKALFKPADILHFHWPDGYINEPGLLKASQRVMMLSFVIICAKLKGTVIAWTVHNITPHDSFHPRLSDRFMRWFVRRCDGFIFMSRESKTEFLSRYRFHRKIRTAIIPHGHYRNCYPSLPQEFSIDPATSSSDALTHGARHELNIPADKKIILSFGMIKSYKNLDALLCAFIDASTNSSFDDYMLVVAGNPELPHLANELENIARGHPNIKLFLQFIPDSDVSLYHCAADIVVLPYKHILNSGALLLALSFNKPVIAPHIGAFVTLQQELGDQWIQTYQDELTGKTLLSAVTAVTHHQRPAICPLDTYNWDNLARLTLQFYQDLAKNF